MDLYLEFEDEVYLQPHEDFTYKLLINNALVDKSTYTIEPGDPLKPNSYNKFIVYKIDTGRPLGLKDYIIVK